MTYYSIDYINSTSDYQECYKYAIFPFTENDYIRQFSIFAPRFKLPLDLGWMKYALVGYYIAISGGDPYDEIVPIALASEFAELNVLADLIGLDPCERINRL